MNIKSSQAYQSFAHYFISLSILSLVFLWIGITQGISTNMFLIFLVSSSFMILKKPYKTKNKIMIIISKLAYCQKEILVNMIGFTVISIITVDKIDGYLYWIESMIINKKYITIYGYELFTKYALAIFVCFFCYYIIIKRLSLAIILVYGFMIFSWHFYIKYSYFYTFIYTIGTISYFIEKASFNKDNPIKENKVNFYGPGLGILIALLAFIIPISLPVLSFQEIEDKMTETFPILETLRNTVQDTIVGNSFSLSDMPFQPDSQKLGGKVVLSDDIALTVKANKPVYLRGSIKQVYTGYSWEKLDVDYYEMQDNKLKINPIKMGYDIEKITVYPESFHTRTIFNPYFTFEVDMEDVELIYTIDLEILRNDGQKSKIKPYTISYFDSYFINEREYTSDEMEQLKPYKEIPNSVSNRTKILAEEITKDKIGVYQKLLAIEEYLKNNYPYDLETSDVPKDKDFVDNFLFEEKKGYCTYFSSSMAVMARSVGIATRYIEGFRMDEEIGGDGFYIVRKSKAHAWVEGYVPGSGWIKFEPTGNLTQAEIDTRNQIDLPEVKTNNNINNQDNMIMMNDKSMREEIDPDFNYNDSSFQNSKIQIFKVSMIIILLVLIILLIFNIKRIILYYKTRRIKKIKGIEGFKRKYNEIIEIIKIIDYSFVDSTPKITIDEINNKYRLVDCELGDLVNLAFYSNEILTLEQLDMMNEAYDKIIEIYTRKKEKINENNKS